MLLIGFFQLIWREIRPANFNKKANRYAGHLPTAFSIVQEALIDAQTANLEDGLLFGLIIFYAPHGKPGTILAGERIFPVQKIPVI